MKKVILFILVSLLTVSVSAQKKVVDPLEKIEKEAKVWFKKFYVQPFFKDPYSYRLVKCFAAPVYVGKELEKEIEDLRGKVEGGEFMKQKRPQSYTGAVKRLHEEYVQKLAVLEAFYNSLTDEQKKGIDKYIIYIHCYAKNSLGNEVLGKYQFTADKDGNFDLSSVVDLN